MAKQAGLIFVDQSEPGITRKRLGGGTGSVRPRWSYFTPEGKRITDREEIDRLNAIALPPAYAEAWYCTNPDGHLLATGIDARGRKQYRYHPQFRATRDCAKFDGLARFGAVLPVIRQRVASDISRRGLVRERAVASVVRLLDSAGIRVGNEAYARTNKSFGATTLRMRHAEVAGQTLRLRFRAKSGRVQDKKLTDRALIRFVRAMQDLPGQHLFQFLDSAGEPCPVGSSDVNAYIHGTLGEEFTAKHFRTWSATVAAFEVLAESKGYVPMREMLEEVSGRLGNTPAIARKSYVHPALLALAADKAAQQLFRETLRLPRRTQWLSRHERGLIAFLGECPDSAALRAA